MPGVSRNAQAPNRVVVLYTMPDGRIGYASYGATRTLCDQTRGIADELYERAADLLSEEAPDAA